VPPPFAPSGILPPPRGTPLPVPVAPPAPPPSTINQLWPTKIKKNLGKVATHNAPKGIKEIQIDDTKRIPHIHTTNTIAQSNIVIHVVANKQLIK
jgi:hypothetical protein